MDQDIKELFQQIKEGQLRPEEAARRIESLKQASARSRGEIQLSDSQNYRHDEPFLKDHTIGGKQVLIGVTHASLSVNAFFKLFPAEPAAQVQKLNFVKPIELGDGEQAEVRVRPQQQGLPMDFTVEYRTNPAGTWITTTTGRLDRAELALGKVDIASLRAAMTPLADTRRIYEAGEPYFHVGESFRVIRELYCGKNEALAQLDLTSALKAQSRAYHFHPLITYSAFTALVPLLESVGFKGAFLPFGFKSLNYRRGQGLDRCWVLVRLVKNSGEMVLFDAEVMSSDFEVVAQLRGCSIKRFRLEEPVSAPAANGRHSVAEMVGATDDLTARVRNYLLKKLGLAEERVDLKANLMELGLESARLVELAGDIESELGIELDPTLFFEHPTLRELTAFFVQEHGGNFLESKVSPVTGPGPARSVAVSAPSREFAPPQPRHFDAEATEGIAVIGMHGRFAGAANLEQFWENLRDGKDVIGEIPGDHWDYRPWYDADPAALDKTYCKWGSFIEGVDQFDPAFFNIPPREADWMDPQVRLVLQSVYAAAEDAGVINRLRGSSTGVFMGICFNDYQDRIAGLNLPVDPRRTGVGGSETAANRVSYWLDLKGPSLVLNTACSSSLFALHLACQSLRSGECGMALVSGANLLLSSRHYRHFSATRALSASGRCRPFDDSADGYIPGECVGTLLLKPLAEAMRDGDPIHAIIKGSAALHGGHTPTLTAPSVSGQENVLLRAWKDAGIQPQTLSYIEAHGTGTKLGDAVELQALKKAFAHFGPRENSCAVGSGKGNIGHTEGASGMASLLKVILQMRHRQIPPLPQFNKLNDYARLESSPLHINAELTEWKSADGPFRAGVSAFGFSGSYAHVVVEEPPGIFEATNPATRDEEPVPIVLSARNEEALRERVRNLQEFLQKADDIRLSDIAYTLQVGREPMEERLALVADSRESLKQKLESWLTAPAAGQDILRHQVGADNGAIQALAADDDMTLTVEAWMRKRKYHQLLQLWVQGFELDWELLYRDARPRRISLPAYPFARERCWIPEAGIQRDGSDLVERKVEREIPATGGEWVFSIADGNEKPGGEAVKLAPTEKAELLLRQLVARQLNSASGALDGKASLPELGLSSLGLVEVIQGIGRILGETLSPTLLFDHASIADFSAYLGREYAAKLAGVVVLKQQKLSPVSADAAAPADDWPLSEGQKGLWVLQRAFPEMSAYNCPLCFRVFEALDTAVFEQACQFLLKQQPILAADIVEKDGSPVFVPQPPTRFKLEKIGAGGWSGEQIRDWIDRAIKVPFDLTHGPLLRGALLAVSERETVVVFTIHHIVFDGSSFALFMKTLVEAYGLLRSGQRPEIRRLPATHRDYVLVESARLGGKEGRDRLAYWRDQLAGELPRLDFPTDRPHSLAKMFAGKTVSTRIPAELGRRLKAFATEHSVYVSALFLGAFKELLHLYSGQTDLIVGLPVNERTEERFRPLIGYFINMLPVRSREVGGRPFLDFVKTVQRTMTTGLANRYPFPALVRELKVPANGGHPVFQAAFEYQNFLAPDGHYVARPPDPGAFPMQWVEGLHQQGEYELALEVYEQGDEFQLNLKYNPTLLEEESASRMAGQIKSLLDSGVKDPGRVPLKEALISQADRETLLQKWNGTECDYPKDVCVHQLFERQAAQNPGAVAVEYGGQSLTYGELEQRSNRLALHLQGLGVEPDAVVGLCMERSLEMIIGILAILKAGGAYLPLDPDYPGERLRVMMENSQAAWILAQSHLAAKVSQFKGNAGVILPGAEGKAGNAKRQGKLRRAVRARNLACVIYTSGSTGHPKGVMVEHQSLCNRLLWMQREYRLEATDRVLQKTPFSFDVSGWEFHWPLMAGARLIFAEPGKHKDPEYIRDLIQKCAITTVHFVPSMLQAFLAVDGVERCASLKRVFCSGEELTVQQKNLFFDRFRETALHNLYGPTEAAIDVTFRACQRDETRVPIGRPISNVRLYVVDPGMKLLPIGFPGELCIAGDCLARGYLNRPDLTAEKFVANPFEPGTVFYRTGDLARWSPDGEIEFLGRLDHQVKIRGFRIEPGEIEDALTRLEGVRQVVVLAEGDGSDKRLVAYYVASEPAIDPATLRQRLRRRLPEHMIPGAFVRLDEIPLTASGKVDRKSLGRKTAPVESTADDDNPRNETEARLAKLWREALRVERVGVQESFFDLGGHSLSALDLIAKINADFGARLPLSTLFETSCIADVAERLNANGAPASRNYILGSRPAGCRPPVYLVPGIGGSSLSFLPLSRALGTRQPLQVFQFPGLEGEREPMRSIEALADFFIGQLLSQPRPPVYFLGGWSLGGVVAYEMACQLQRRGILDTRLILLDSYLQEHLDRFLPMAGRMDFSGGAEICELPDQGSRAGNGDAEAGGHSAAVLAANHQALRNYRAKEVYKGRVIYFFGTERAQAARGNANGSDPASLRAWGEGETRRIWEQYLPQFAAGFVPVAGSHYSMLEEPAVGCVAAGIISFLEDAGRFPNGPVVT